MIIPAHCPRLGAVAVALTLVVCPAFAAATPTAELRAVFEECNTILKDPATAERPGDRIAAVLEVVSRVFAFRDAAERALGREWAARTPSEQAEFVRLFAALLERSFVFTLASRADLEAGVDVQFRGESLNGARATVLTTVLARDHSDVPVDYRMVRHGERWMIDDVVVDGVSVIANYRAQFARVLRTSSYADLSERMRASAVALTTDWPSGRPSVDVATAPVADQRAAVTVAAIETESRAQAPSLVAATHPVPAPRTEPQPDRTPRAPAPSNATAPAPRAAAPTLTPVVAASAFVATAAPPPAPTSARTGVATTRAFWVQVGAFKDPHVAGRLAEALLKRRMPVSIASPAAPDTAPRFTRVRVGPFADRAAAVSMLERLQHDGYSPFVVPDR